MVFTRNWKIVTTSVACLIVGVVLIVVSSRFGAQKHEQTAAGTATNDASIVVTNSPLQVQPKADVVPPSPTRPPEEEPLSVEQDLATAGTISNDRYRYSFSYPANTHLAQMYPLSMSQEDFASGLTFEQLRRQYGTSLCWVASFSAGGTFSISAKDNADAHYIPCQRTGVGACILTNVSETVRILDKLTLAKGTKFDCSKDEGFVSFEYAYDLPDLTRLHFTWTQYGSHTAAMLATQRQEVLTAVESFTVNK